MAKFQIEEIKTVLKDLSVIQEDVISQEKIIDNKYQNVLSKMNLELTNQNKNLDYYQHNLDLTLSVIDQNQVAISNDESELANITSRIVQCRNEMNSITVPVYKIVYETVTDSQGNSKQEPRSVIDEVATTRAKQRIESLKQEISRLESRIPTLKSHISYCKSNISSLYDMRYKINSSISKTNAYIQEVNNEMNLLAISIEEYKKCIKEITSKYSDLINVTTKALELTNGYISVMKNITYDGETHSTSEKSVEIVTSEALIHEKDFLERAFLMEAEALKTVGKAISNYQSLLEDDISKEASELCVSLGKKIQEIAVKYHEMNLKMKDAIAYISNYEALHV